jgi:hypothetical protein
MIIDPHQLAPMLALYVTRLTVAIVAALITCLLLGTILVKLLLDLYAEESDSPESRLLDWTQDSKQRPVKPDFSRGNSVRRHSRQLQSPSTDGRWNRRA